METLRKKIEKNGRKIVLRLCALFLALMLLLTSNVFGDTTGSGNISPAGNQTNNNDSIHAHQVWNGTAWVNSTQESDSAALAEAQKKADHDTFMTYLYMALGFFAILAIAWLTRGKEKKGGNEVPNTNAVKHNPGINDKKYGSHKPRR